jgi:hypothetical protein
MIWSGMVKILPPADMIRYDMALIFADPCGEQEKVKRKLDAKGNLAKNRFCETCVLYKKWCVIEPQINCPSKKKTKLR